MLLYLSTPSRVCNHNVAFFTLLELRQRAMDRLGERSDIKEFHDQILGNGPLPLEILTRIVEEWIDEKQSS
jgi:uncharacterized protein (DUF885 family)